jgi:hypothetical protein
MRWFALVAVLGALSASTAAATAAPHRHHRPPARCSSGSHRVLAADGQAVVYAERGSEIVIGEHSGPAKHAVPLILGCISGAQHTYRLGLAWHCVEGEVGTIGYCLGVRREVLAGPFVAYEETQTPCSPGCFWRVVVRDLRTGKMLRREPTGTSSYPGFEEREGVGQVAAIVVSADGAVAWTVGAAVDYDFVGKHTVYVNQIHVADSAGSQVVAAGNGIDLGSLALGGDTLYWTEEGKPHSALLG